MSKAYVVEFFDGRVIIFDNQKQFLESPLNNAYWVMRGEAEIYSQMPLESSLSDSEDDMGSDLPQLH